MQPHGGRPVVVAPSTIASTQEMIEAARLAAAVQGAGMPGAQLSVGPANLNALGSGFTAFAMPSSGYPEIALFSQFNQLFGGPQFNTAELAQLQQTQKLALAGLTDDKGAANRGKVRSSDSRTSSAYASRHQAAEQRRRTRINERLEMLRKMVPHAERANTACFLEEVIKYIDALKKRSEELEKALLMTNRAAGEGKLGLTGHLLPNSAAQASASANPTALSMEDRLTSLAQQAGHSQLLLAAHAAVPQTLTQQVQLPQFQSPHHHLNLQLLNNHQVISLQLQRQLQQLTGQAAPGTPPAQSQGTSSQVQQLLQQQQALQQLAEGLQLPASTLTGKRSGSESPSSSEESMPLKKRKMLVL